MDRYKDRIDQTISDLSHAILAITQRDNIEYTLKPHTTNNYALMVANYHNTGILEVSIEGCDTSIYRSPAVNLLARVFHDRVHIQKSLDFSEEHELRIAKFQRGEIFNQCKLMGLSNIRASRAAILLYLDIADQVSYFYKYNKFVEDQYTFVMERFRRYLAMEAKSETPDDFLKVYSEYASQIS